MSLNKGDEEYIKIWIVVTLALALILFLLGMKFMALSVIFISGGILGLITNTMPFLGLGMSRSFPVSRKIDYEKGDISGISINILFIVLGLMIIFN